MTVNYLLTSYNHLHYLKPPLIRSVGYIMKTAMPSRMKEKTKRRWDDDKKRKMRKRNTTPRTIGTKKKRRRTTVMHAISHTHTHTISYHKQAVR